MGSYYHNFRHWFTRRWQVNKQVFIFNLIASIAWAYLVLSTAYDATVVENGVNHLDVLAALTVIIIARVLVGLRPTETQEELEFRSKRKIYTSLFLDNIHQLLTNKLSGSSITEDELSSVRKDILICIAEHVRQFRRDFSGINIFTNLLVEVPTNKIKVIVRNSPRKNGKEYSKDKLQCSKVFNSGKVVCCGNVKKVTQQNKEYKSFIALPVMDLNEKCIAVVTIDSKELHHFDHIYEELETTLRPYLRTLAITFTLAA